MVNGFYIDVPEGALPYDKVEPFPQVEPTTVSQKAAVRLKPQLHISKGCHPYAAVNAAGEITAGITTTGDHDCSGRGIGSQVYVRSTWYNDVWAIMYAWYFPSSLIHDWKNIVVWIDNPSLAVPKVLGVSAQVKGGYLRYNKFNWDNGDFQNLIMWDQLTEAARTALNNTNFKGNGDATVPFIDANFMANLKFAIPYVFA
ncbi:hypothetical protein P3T76_000459 [Phytophthora citrophthora]|uniref:Necrosis inducing-like protein NPP1 type n=1 Tax=Phytophthora citrophthora TaxID=4793 RepID=A0AAD9H0N6_9STRA|nr:hypothetical protein P3T76_000459 [Phytophthora citrophthora]